MGIRHLQHRPWVRRQATQWLRCLSVLTVAGLGGSFVLAGRAEAAPVVGWVCSDSNFRGNCIPISQDIPRLGLTAVGNDRASSLLMAEGTSLSLYLDTDYGSVCQTFSANAPDLRNTLIGNDRASSVRVGSTCPSAILFKDSNYSGTYVTSDQLRYTVGGTTRYWSLGLGTTTIGNAQLSSVVVSPGHSVSIYEGLSLSGACITLYGNTPSLGALGFNDRARSVWVDPPSPCFHPLGG